MRARLSILILLLTFASALPAADAEAKRKRVRLKAFSSCSNLIAYGNRWAPRLVTAPVTRGPQPVGGGVEDGAGGGEAPQAAPAPAPAAGEAEDFSTTNVQEAGVDEPDIVKTDGRLIYAIARGALHVVDVSGDAPRLAGRLRLGEGFGHQLLVDGDRALVAWQDFPGAVAAQTPSIAPVFHRPTTKLALVSLRDPAEMRVLRTLTVDGSFVSSRMTGSTVRVVLATTPNALAPQPVDAGPARARTAARRISRRRAAAWLPRGTFVNRRKHTRRSRALVACRSTRHPTAFSGLGMLTVLTIDLGKGLDPVDSDALMAGGETVYASKDRLFVASQRYVRSVETGSSVPDGMTTEIHAFDVSDPQRTVYTGTGSVPGFLLNQFSMSERKGVLRVASTEQPSWFGGEPGTSSSTVTTLRERGGLLARIGSVGGLGKGERIYSVRFFDEIGFVVTFRQTDPLYTIDLRDPAAPKVLGELKIRGFSSYLHPAGEGLLIGVGQDATEEGRRLGTQVSLFDVSDPANPTRIQQASLGTASSSDVEYDHRAFLWWPARNLAVLPVQVYGEPSPEPQPAPEDPSAPPESQPSEPPPPPFIGAIGFSVKRDGIAEAGRITHASGDYDYEAAITRSLVIGDRLYTLSSAGLKASSLETLQDVAYLAFER